MSSPEESVGELLRKKNLTVSAAESCTGGRVGDKITNISGSSDYFLGSAVTYSNKSKIEILGVSKGSLEAHGAVSEQVAKEMAIGSLRRFESDIGVSTTGIAGPAGGTPKKPVGLIWFAVTDGKEYLTQDIIFPGDRLSIKENAANHAISMIIAFIKDE